MPTLRCMPSRITATRPWPCDPVLGDLVDELLPVPGRARGFGAAITQRCAAQSAGFQRVNRCHDSADRELRIERRIEGDVRAMYA
jgi:hypothetical protein